MIDIKVIGSSSKGNCYKVSDGETSLLIECGTSILNIKKALNFKLSDISGCLASHCHLDHAKAAKDVIKAGIDLYTSKETAEALCLTGHRVNHVAAMSSFKIGTWSILPFGTQHDCPGSLGFLLASVDSGEKLLFLTDSAFCKYKFSGLNYLMLECNFSNEILEKNIEAGVVERSRRKRLLESHFSLDRVKYFLKSNDISKLRSIHLIHLSDQNSDEELFKSEIQKLTGVPTYIAKA